MLNLGIDFGSTYTTVSVYRQETGMVESISMASSPYIPSMVAQVGDKYEFARAAKSRIGRRGVTVFRGFKMLLPETDGEALAARGYAGENMPREIARRFLDYCLRQALEILHETQVDNLVVGAPEIWNESIGTMDGRTVLRNIFQGMDCVKHVQVASEPAAATAFFAHNFQLCTGKPYEGCILLIDYGGGTLDITLTSVSAAGAAGAMEIKVLERTGAGENVEGKIGQAGIVYMETVMAQAIAQSGVLEGQPLKTDSRFFKAVDSLEEELQFRTDAIRETFDEYGLEDLEDLEQEFTTVDYMGQEIPVTYRLLVEVYNREIRPVLGEKLDLMIDYMKKRGIPYLDRTQDNFKIALVGGFGNYYLVKKQIEEKFAFSTMDRRQADIIQNQSDREKAISLGAAMLSAGVITIRNTAPYSIGIFGRDADGKPCIDYAFTYKQEIVFDQPYFPLDKESGKVIRYLVTSGRISRFIINRGSDDATAMVVPVKPDFAGRLEHVVSSPFWTAAIGFSLDASGVLSIHIRDYDMHTQTMGEDHKVELTRFSELFALTKVKRVMDDEI